jgi:hypothetical protein
MVEVEEVVLMHMMQIMLELVMVGVAVVEVVEFMVE